MLTHQRPLILNFTYYTPRRFLPSAGVRGYGILLSHCGDFVYVFKVQARRPL